MTPGHRHFAGLAALALALVVLLAGCGHAGSTLAGVQGGPGRTVVAAGLPFIATKNTTRVAGSDPTADAAAIAGAVFPGGSNDTRPQAVALADANDWQAALAAASLMSAPLRAPLLLGDGGGLPAATATALTRLAPSGSSAAAGAQVIRIGAVASPNGLRATTIGGSNPFALAAAIDRFVSAARGAVGNSVIVVSADAPPFAMPAAAWAAKSGDPILFVTRDSVPPETRAAIARRPQAHIYVLGPPATVGARVVTQLSGLGTVKRIGSTDPVSNAIAFARYVDGRFGWGVDNPGHGLVFADEGHTLDAAAAAPLSASGTFGPLLLLDSADHLPAALSQYLLDIQPGYADDPVRGVYNHGWLVGDEHAISSAVQARIDALLEITAVNPTRTSP